MSRSSLVLYAASSELEVAPQRLINLLISCGLIDRPLGDQAFLAGDRFFQHITFLGCSPSIALLPEQGENFLRIDISCYAEPVLFAGSRAHTPLCRYCGKPYAEDWKERIQSAGDSMLRCAGCGRSKPIAQLNFRRRACYSRSIIRISPVFESEAMPSPQLLEALASAFDMPFRYAYL